MRARVTEKQVGRMLAGISAAAAASCILLFVFSMLISEELINCESSRLCIYAVNATAAFVCGTVSAKGDQKGRVLRALIAGLGFALLLLLISAMIAIDALSIAQIIRILLISTLGAICGSTVHLGKSNKKLRKRGYR